MDLVPVAAGDQVQEADGDQVPVAAGDLVPVPAGDPVPVADGDLVPVPAWVEVSELVAQDPLVVRVDGEVRPDVAAVVYGVAKVV